MRRSPHTAYRDPPLFCRHLVVLDPVKRCGKPAVLEHALRFCLEHGEQVKAASTCRDCGEPSDAGWCLTCFEASEGRLVRDTHVLGDLPRGTA